MTNFSLSNDACTPNEMALALTNVCPYPKQQEHYCERHKDNCLVCRLEWLDKQAINGVEKTLYAYRKDHYKKPEPISDRNTTGEAFFHGECWVRCKLCGRTYESQCAHRRDGKDYCPECDGLGDSADAKG